MAEYSATITRSQQTRSAEPYLPSNHRVNVGDLERWLSVLGGGVLALYLGQRFLGPLVLLGGAGALLSRGLTGYCALYKKMGVSTVPHEPGAPPAGGATEAEEQTRLVIARS